MKKLREAQESDSEDFQRAVGLIGDLTSMNPGIAGSIWVSAFAFIISQSFFNNGLSFENYCEELEKIKEGYRQLWDCEEFHKIKEEYEKLRDANDQTE